MSEEVQGFIEVLKFLKEEKNVHPYNFPVDLENQEEVLRIKKESYGNYEFIVDVDGKVYLPRPSHTEGLIRIAATKKGMDRDEFYETCPPEYYCDMISWGILESGGAIAVWDKGYAGKANRKQMLALRKIKANGMHEGPLVLEKE